MWSRVPALLIADKGSCYLDIHSSKFPWRGHCSAWRESSVSCSWHGSKCKGRGCSCRALYFIITRLEGRAGQCHEDDRRTPEEFAFERASPSDSGWPWTLHHADSASWLLGFQVCYHIQLLGLFLACVCVQLHRCICVHAASITAHSVF